MNQIERDVFVLKDAIKEPIDYTRFTNAIPISFNFRDYTIPDGATAKVFCAKPSGKAVYTDASISGNTVTVTVTDQMFIELGVTEVQVEIISGQSTLVSFAWPVNVQPNYTEGDIPPSQNEAGFFGEAQKAIDNANAAAESANQAAQNVNAAVDAAQKATQAANTAAQTATSAASSANDAAQTAGKAASAASDMAQSASNAADSANSAAQAANTAAGSANSAATSANQAAESANDAADAANQAVAAITGKLGINDDIPSEGTTYSSDKIEAMAQTNHLSDSVLSQYLNGTSGTNYDFNNGTITVTAEQTGVNIAAYVEIALPQNTDFSISYKSTRSGSYGGFITVQGRETGGTLTTIANANYLNSSVRFNTSNYSRIRIVFWVATTSSQSEIGDSATFWDIMLIEGCIPSTYIPDAYKQTELAAVMNKRSAVNLLSVESPIGVRASVEKNGNGIKVTATQAETSLTYAYLRFLSNQNEEYTISFNSTITGETGGGIQILGVGEDGSLNTILMDINGLNAIHSFNSGIYETIQFNFYSSAAISGGGQNGDSATFTDIMLVEGSFEGRNYVPYIGFETLSEAIADLQSKVSALQASTANAMMYVLSDDTQAKMIEDETSMLLKEAQS